MDVLVSDTSVLIDLERGKLIEPCFNLPYRFTVPDVLYERELKDYGGDDLIELGLEIVEADETISAAAVAYLRQEIELSAPDSFALALANTQDWCLLAGDGALRKLATAQGVECHGVLWVLDELQTQKVAAPDKLLDGLTVISNHPRCRLPKAEIRRRITAYKESVTIMIGS